MLLQFAVVVKRNIRPPKFANHSPINLDAVLINKAPIPDAA